MYSRLKRRLESDWREERIKEKETEEGRIGWEGGRERQQEGKEKGRKEQSHEGREDAGSLRVVVIERTTENEHT